MCMSRSPPWPGPAGVRAGPDLPVCGRWWESSPGAWTGVLGERVWTLRQEQDRLWYTVYGEEQDGRPDGAETDQILRDYFQLDVGLPALYRAWGAADPLFRKVANDFPGEVALWGHGGWPQHPPGVPSLHPAGRRAGAAAGPRRVPPLLHLHLQQPHLPHHCHDRAPLPSLRPPPLLP